MWKAFLLSVVLGALPLAGVGVRGGAQSGEAADFGMIIRGPVQRGRMPAETADGRQFILDVRDAEITWGMVPLTAEEIKPGTAVFPYGQFRTRVAATEIVTGPAAEEALRHAQRLECEASQWALAQAKDAWAKKAGRKPGDAVPLSLVGEHLERRLRCPAGGVYRIGRIGEAPSCSYTGHRF